VVTPLLYKLGNVSFGGVVAINRPTQRGKTVDPRSWSACSPGHWHAPSQRASNFAPVPRDPIQIW